MMIRRYAIQNTKLSSPLWLWYPISTDHIRPDLLVLGWVQLQLMSSQLKLFVWHIIEFLVFNTIINVQFRDAVSYNSYAATPLNIAILSSVVAAAALSELSSIGRQMSQACSQYALPALCYGAFPLCATDGDTVYGRTMCRDDCDRLERSVCAVEYESARRTTVRIGKLKKNSLIVHASHGSRNGFRLLKAGKLPTIPMFCP